MAPRANSGDQTLTVLDEVADDLDGAAADNRAAARQLRRLSARRRQGHPWRDVLVTSSTRNLLGHVADVASRLATGTGRLRRAVIHALRADGARVGEIAEHLGVSHQRVSRLINGDRANGPGSADRR
jgi:Homeodomain-like domain-containing protein